MPNIYASIDYEDNIYSYINPRDAGIQIVGQDEITTDQVATSSNIAYSIAGRSRDSSEMATSVPLTREEMHPDHDQVPTADNICYASAIPQDHSDQVTTSDNVAYGSTIR